MRELLEHIASQGEFKVSQKTSEMTKYEMKKANDVHISIEFNKTKCSLQIESLDCSNLGLCKGN